MPTVEFYGFTADQPEAIRRARTALADVPFRDDIVFVHDEQPTRRVVTWNETDRPFVRIATRSRSRASLLADRLVDHFDVEMVLIDFRPGGAAAEETTFESRLVDALEPLRGLALANAIFHLFDSGLFDALRETPGTSTGSLAAALEFDLPRLRGFLHYLENEDLVRRRDDGYELTESGAAYAEFEPWYVLLVGGYAGTFRQVGDRLKAGTPWAEREADHVGVGSCGISRYDAFPLTRRLLNATAQPCRTFLDLGCGDGRSLIELVASTPGARGIGVDVDQRNTVAADKLAAGAGVADRVRFATASAAEFLEGSRTSVDPLTPDCLVLAFVLQEVLEQAGEEAVVDLLRRATARFPGLHVVVIEVDHRPDDVDVMRRGLGRAYYNPYFLVHAFTEQRLETRQFWDGLFHRAGLEIVARGGPDPSVDSTGLEIGYLLRRAE